mmetsp:Transcript_25793/g.29732  ORF Transcript_25793/g.29732 Transcript_25793/m.29732 type:complete len:118 (-) Transcript_25793:750-1103(-)
MSNNSIDSRDPYSDSANKFDEEILNPVSIFNEDYDESIPISNEMKEEAIVNDIMNGLLADIKENLFPLRDDDHESLIKSDSSNNEHFDEIPTVIRVSEISRKTQKKKELDHKVLTTY